jgi:hypothetical protein
MLAVPIVFSLSSGGGGMGEVVAAIVSSVLLLVGIGIWIWWMHRPTETGAMIELPLRTQTKAA